MLSTCLGILPVIRRIFHNDIPLLKCLHVPDWVNTTFTCCALVILARNINEVERLIDEVIVLSVQHTKERFAARLNFYYRITLKTLSSVTKTEGLRFGRLCMAYVRVYRYGYVRARALCQRMIRYWLRGSDITLSMTKSVSLGKS